MVSILRLRSPYILIATFLFATFPVNSIANPHVAGFERWHSGKNVTSDAGLLLLGELNCTSCHKAEGSAAQVISIRKAPMLDKVTARIKPGYLKNFIKNPQGIKPGSTMPNLFHGLSEKEQDKIVEPIVHYLLSLHQSGPKQSYAPMGGRTRGKHLFHTVGCMACHGPKEGKGKDLPFYTPLGDLKAKYTLPSLAEFLINPLHVRTSGRMPSLNLSAQDAHDLAAYLLPDVPEKAGLAYKYYEGSWNKLPDFGAMKPKAMGAAKSIDVSYRKRNDHFGLRFEGALAISKAGEYTFHLGSDDGSWLKINNKMVVNHDGIHGYSMRSGKIRLEKGTHHVLVDIFEQAGDEKVQAEIEGPGMSRRPLAKVIMSTPISKKIAPLEFAFDPNLVAQGRKLFASQGCASCHQLREKPGAPIIANTRKAPSLTQIKAGTGCLSKTPGKSIPNYQLSGEQRQAISSVLSRLKKPVQLSLKDKILHTMTRLNCYACHERGDRGPALETLPLFQGTQPEMGDEGRIPPLLNGVGGKLTKEWLAHILADGTEERPYMLTNMPKFGKENAGHLQKLLEETDKLPPLARIPLNEKKAKIAGWKMVGDKGFSCIKCHSFGRFKATGVQSMDLQIMTKRLREEWFRRYMDNPSKFRPGTRMPDAWPASNGKSLLADILDGRNETQIQAIWMYLSDGIHARVPRGIVTKSMELIPFEDPVVYRNFIQGAGPRAIGVGFLEQISLAYDANDLRIALIWQGAFIDASKHWTGRGSGFQGPAGKNVLQLPEGPQVAILDAGNSPWPTMPPRKSGYQFRGYRLDAKGRPTFMYALRDIQVKDFPRPEDQATKILLKRTIELSSEKGVKNAYLRAALANSIQALENNWYLVDGKLKIQVIRGQASIHGQGRKELRVLADTKGKQATIEIAYDW